MEDPTVAYEDMLFFERRLTEVISSMQPKVKKWRIVLSIVFLSTLYNAYFWIFDPSIRFITLWESLLKHPLFAISFILLLILFLVCGVHKRVVAPKIIALRCRSVLADFCLSCDESGKLIVRPASTSLPVLNQQSDNLFGVGRDPQKRFSSGPLKIGSVPVQTSRMSLLLPSNPLTQVSPSDEQNYRYYQPLATNTKTVVVSSSTPSKNESATKSRLRDSILEERKTRNYSGGSDNDGINTLLQMNDEDSNSSFSDKIRLLS